MTVADIIKRSLSDFQAADRAGFPLHYARYFAMYLDWQKLRARGFPRAAARQRLAQRYGVSERSVFSIIEAYTKKL